MSKAKLDTCEQHWGSKLSAYTLKLKHLAGMKNVMADALSRPFCQNHEQQVNEGALSWFSPKVMTFMNLKRQPSRRERANMNSRTLSLFRQWDKLKIVVGILYWVMQDPHSKHKHYQLVLPSSLKGQALTGVHDLAGHQGQARSTHLARQCFFWPGMGHDICEYIKCCQRCILAKAPEPSAWAPLESIKTSMPMELGMSGFLDCGGW